MASGSVRRGGARLANVLHGYINSSSSSSSATSASWSQTGIAAGELAPFGVSMASTHIEGSKKWRFSMVFLFLPCLATFGLGTWQLIRREEKVGTRYKSRHPQFQETIKVLDYRRRRLEEEPVPLSEIIDVTKPGAKPTGATTDDLEYRKVICEGVYDGTKSLYVGPRAKSDFGVAQKGYYLVTPLMGGHGDNRWEAHQDVLSVPVLVNRGWVPSGYKDDVPNKAATFENIPAIDINSETDPGSWWRPWSKGRKSNKKDEVTVPTRDQAAMKICGVIRDSEQPNMFVPPNAPEAGQWFYVDVAAMARAVGLPEDTILIEAVQDRENNKANNKYPIPKNPEALLHASVMPQDHINYALTWYTLSAATTFMAVKRVRNPRRTSTNADLSFRG